MRKRELHPRTAIINQQQKNKSAIARRQALLWLAAKFPQSFDNSLRIKPLKRGIMADILAYREQAQEAGISISKLREAVVVFTRRVDYLVALKTRESRIDLQGNPVDEVSEEEAEIATSKLKRRLEKNARSHRKSQPINKPAPAIHHQRNTTSYPSKYHAPEQTHSAYSADRVQGFISKSAQAATVIVKKAARQYDPTAVSRLKERLGIVRQYEREEELVD